VCGSGSLSASYALISVMDFSQVRLGARIEFFEQLSGPDGGPSGYVGAAAKDEAFVGAGVPRQGDYVSVASLVGGRPDPAYRLMTGSVPFLPVAHVEHYLVAIGPDDEIPEWWGAGYRAPSSILVFRAQAIQDEAHGPTSLVRALEAQGWAVDPRLRDFSVGFR
jgi:hypothetical protein